MKKKSPKSKNEKPKKKKKSNTKQEKVHINKSLCVMHLNRTWIQINPSAEASIIFTHGYFFSLSHNIYSMIPKDTRFPGVTRLFQ